MRENLLQMELCLRQSRFGVSFQFYTEVLREPKRDYINKDITGNTGYDN